MFQYPEGRKRDKEFGDIGYTVFAVQDSVDWNPLIGRESAGGNGAKKYMTYFHGKWILDKDSLAVISIVTERKFPIFPLK